MSFGTDKEVMKRPVYMILIASLVPLLEAFDSSSKKITHSKTKNQNRTKIINKNTKTANLNKYR